MTWSPADDLFTVGDNIQLISLTDGDDNAQAADIRAFNKEVSLTELAQLHDDTIGLGTTAWSLCFADLAGVQPRDGWKIIDADSNVWQIKAVRLRTAATRWVCYAEHV
jgi:hypothetical protein